MVKNSVCVYPKEIPIPVSMFLTNKILCLNSQIVGLPIFFFFFQMRYFNFARANFQIARVSCSIFVMGVSNSSDQEGLDCKSFTYDAVILPSKYLALWDRQLHCM